MRTTFCLGLLLLGAIALSTAVDQSDDDEISNIISEVLGDFDDEIDSDIAEATQEAAAPSPPITDAWSPATIDSKNAEGIVSEFLVLANRARLSCKLSAFTKASITTAKHQLTTGGLWDVEIAATADGIKQIFHATFYHRLPSERTFKLEGKNLISSAQQYRLREIKPLFCASGKAAQLATTFVDAESHNAQELGWKKTVYPQFFGKTEADMEDLLGAKPVDLSKVAAEDIQTITDEDIALMAPPPASYDFRTVYPNCRSANEVYNQGSCGSCYAQAAATAMGARMCQASAQSVNVKISAQQAKDCTGGCGGGSGYTVYQYSQTNGLVEEYCETETQAAGVCGTGMCATGAKYKVASSTVMQTASATPANRVLAIQNEVATRGPMYISYDVFTDFSDYKSGVYIKTATATKRGGHAVVLMGWGTENGVDYWLCQNSWGDSWGIKGFFKIRRGTDECGIESQGPIYPVVNVAPSNIPSSCTTKCLNAGSLTTDCKCRCAFGWSGATCSTCGVVCQNKGTLNSARCSCTCPAGTKGTDCSSVQMSLSVNEACKDGSGKVPTLNWNSPIGKGSMCYLRTEAGADTWNAQSRLCGEEASWTAASPLCPQTGSVPLGGYKNIAPGSYYLVCLNFLGKNEFGQSKGYSYLSTQSLGALVIKASGCK